MTVDATISIPTKSYHEWQFLSFIRISSLIFCLGFFGQLDAVADVIARHNAGGSLYTDQQGNQWTPDGTLVSGASKTGSKSFDVAGTTDDPLYLSYRYASSSGGPGADFALDIPVTGDGPYTVKLHFVEPYFGVPGLAPGGTGKRVFDVFIEGQLVLDDYDLNAQVSPGTIVINTFSQVTVSDGSLTVSFHSEVNNAIISAIEVEEDVIVPPPPPPPPPLETIRINGGSGAYTDGDGNEWVSNAPYLTGSSRNSVKSFDALGTEEDGLYLTYTYAGAGEGSGTDFGYEIPVSGNGPFTVNLHFLEPFFGAPGLAPGGTGKRVFDVNIEGNQVMDNYDINAQVAPATILVNSYTDFIVNDGSLSINFHSEVDNAIISAVEVITEAPPSEPYFTRVDPSDGATNVSISNFQITVGVVTPPEYELDETTLSGNVGIFKVTAQGEEEVPSNVNDTGGGDAVILTPTVDLEPLTTYTFRVDGVEANRLGDFNDRMPFLAFASTFTTSVDDNENPVDLSGVSFTRVTGSALGAGVDDRFTSLVIGPDGRLYGSTIAGQIKRWTINANGTLTNLQVLQPALSGSPHPETGETPQEPRLIIGLCFGPEATAGNLVAYVTHSAAVLSNGPEWDGKVSRLSGPDLGQVQDILIHLPRSKKDHLTNSIIVGPDNDLYLSQGSNSAGGAPDPAWGNRPERLLSAAILKIDLDKLPSSLPLSVYTTDNIGVINAAPATGITMSDGTYNPYSSDAPLTIFSSGVRNAYDLVWHSNGFLYIPTNGTAGNDTSSPNAPASADFVPVRRVDGSIATDASIPALNGGETQKDWLFKASLHTYHGHPNGLRGEFVLNHGGITYSGIPGMSGPYVDVAKYPDDLGPDPHYVEPAFDFVKNKSPNGAIEYRSNAFGGTLQGMLMVVRFSGQDDVMLLRPGNNSGEILEVYDNVTGLQNFDDPLDLIEDPNTGNLYVAQYDRGSDINQQLVLLRADVPASNGGNLPPLVVQSIPDQQTQVGEGFALNVSGTFNDPEGDAITLSARSTGGDPLPGWLSFSGTLLTGVPQTADIGTVGITISADDGNGGVSTDSFILTVNAAGGTNLDMDYFLVDADTDQIIHGPIADGDVIDITGVANFSIFVENYPTATTRVLFNVLAGPYEGHFKGEGQTPYALFGDTPRGDFIGQPIAPGDEFTLRGRAINTSVSPRQTLVDETFSFSVVSGNNLRVRDNLLETAAVTQLQSEEGLRVDLIYPNPVSDGLVNVHVTSGVPDLFVNLVDLQGKSHYAKVVTLESSAFQLNMAPLIPGVYFLQISDGSTSVVRRVARE